MNEPFKAEFYESMVIYRKKKKELLNFRLQLLGVMT